MQRKIIHVDMDCFYAAVEMRDNPDLRYVPMAVGGDADQRGVLCTSNYIARKFGVRSAMATALAKKFCPDLIVVHPRFEKYREVSQRIRKIFSDYTNLVEPLSLDEAYLDVTDCKQYQGSATRIAKEIRERIQHQESLTASAGVASNKFLAKIASDWKKPNGLFVITPEKIKFFIKDLPIEKVFGIGKVTAKKLHRRSIKTCGDLQQLTRNELLSAFGVFGDRLYHLCRGEDEREVKSHRERKSLSVEHTYLSDLPDLEACFFRLDNLWEELKHRLEKHACKHPDKQFVKIKFDNFQQTTVECHCNEISKSVFKHLLAMGYQRQRRAVRLLGVGVGFCLVDSAVEQQLDLWY